AVRHALDDAGNLMSRYRGQALRPVAIPVRFLPGQLRRRNASGANSDACVSCAQLGLGRILVHKLLRAALSMESNGFHLGSFTDSANVHYFRRDTRRRIGAAETSRHYEAADFTVQRHDARALLTQQ